MTNTEKLIKYAAIGFAILLIIGIIGGIASIVGAIIGVNIGAGDAVGETKTYEAEGEVNILEVDIGAADFRIEKGEKLFVESNLKHLTFRQIGKRLVLGEKSFGSKSYNGAFITIYIPEDTELDEIDISTGAGKFTADFLSARSIDLEFGAGDVNIGELYASDEVDIDGGTGQITIGAGSMRNLQLDMGMGALYLTSEIKGNGELNLGVGEARITLLGSRDDYAVELEKGIGEIRFDGEVISNGNTFGNGSNRIEIEGGIGSVSVEFSQ